MQFAYGYGGAASPLVQKHLAASPYCSFLAFFRSHYLLLPLSCISPSYSSALATPRLVSDGFELLSSGCSVITFTALIKHFARNILICRFKGIYGKEKPVTYHECYPPTNNKITIHDQFEAVD